MHTRRQVFQAADDAFDLVVDGDHVPAQDAQDVQIHADLSVDRHGLGVFGAAIFDGRDVANEHGVAVS